MANEIPLQAPTATARKSVAVTPDNTTNISGWPARALFIGVAGDVTIVNIDDTTCTYSNHPVGYLLAQCKRVNATGTAATNIVALL